MNLLELPPEILINIVKTLDSISVFAVYNTCKVLRAVLSEYAVIKGCDFSLSYLATARTLQSQSFKGICNNLKELSLKAVPDLNKNSLVSALKEIKNLVTLDVSFTNITLIDLVDVQNACPTIENVSVDLVIDGSRSYEISMNYLEAIQNLFSKYKNVELVTACSNFSHLPLYILAKNHNKGFLKLIVISVDHPFYNYTREPCLDLFSFTELCITMIDWRHNYIHSVCMVDERWFDKFNFDKLEFVVITRTSYCECYVRVSQMFMDYFFTRFNIRAECVEFNTIRPLVGNVMILLWNKENTKFDKGFFSRLYDKVKKYFPYQCKTSFSNFDLPIEGKSDFYNIEFVPNTEVELKNNMYHIVKKTKRMPKPVLLDLDRLFEKQQQIKCYLNLKPFCNSLMLSSESNYLKKITHLNIKGCVVYAGDFFSILFKCCDNLITLSIETCSLAPVTLTISNTVKFSKSLKNLRIVDSNINHKYFFTCLSDCQTLENLHICDKSLEAPTQLETVTCLIAKCKKLYSVHLESSVSENIKFKLVLTIKILKLALMRPFLNFEICSEDQGKSYDPFLGVFCVNPMRP